MKAIAAGYIENTAPHFSQWRNHGYGTGPTSRFKEGQNVFCECAQSLLVIPTGRASELPILYRDCNPFWVRATEVKMIGWYTLLSERRQVAGEPCRGFESFALNSIKVEIVSNPHTHRIRSDVGVDEKAFMCKASAKVGTSYPCTADSAGGDMGFLLHWLIDMEVILRGPRAWLEVSSRFQNFWKRINQSTETALSKGRTKNPIGTSLNGSALALRELWLFNLGKIIKTTDGILIAKKVLHSYWVD